MISRLRHALGLPDLEPVVVDDPRPKPKPPREAAARSYAAAEIGRLRMNWGTNPLRISEVIREQRDILVRRSRQQFRSNPHARSIVNLQIAHTVGAKGLGLVCRPPGQDGPDLQLGQAVERRWRKFWNSTVCDLYGTRTGLDFQRLYVGNLATEGDYILRIHDNLAAPSIQLELIDSARLPANHDADLANGNLIRASVEYDLEGAPVAYHVQVSPNQPGAIPEGPSPWALASGAVGTRYFVRIPAREILHDFIPTESDQRRGLPGLATALDRLRMTDAYLEAALVAARVGASKIAWLRDPEGEAYGGEDDEEGDEPTFSAEPGEIGRLRAGEELIDWSPDYPRGETPGFIRIGVQSAAAGTNTHYASVSRDTTGENYSSMQSGRIQDADYYEGVTHRLETRVVGEIFARWLRRELADGGIFLGNVPGQGSIPLRRYDAILEGTTWSKHTFRSINPAVDAQARRIEVEAGVRSRSSVIRERGEDPTEVFREISEEQAMLGDLNVAVSPDGSSVSVADPVDPMDPDKEEPTP